MKIVTLNRQVDGTIEVHFEAIGLFVECKPGTPTFFKILGLQEGTKFAVTADHLTLTATIDSVCLDGRTWIAAEDLVNYSHNALRRLGV